MDSFACLKTENILSTMELFALGYLCVFLTACSAFTSVSYLFLFWTSGFSVWGDPGGVVVLSSFLGGLSLHLNHLIGQGVSAPYRQFGTLPIGIFLSNLDSGQLETSLMTSYCHF